MVQDESILDLEVDMFPFDKKIDYFVMAKP